VAVLPPALDVDDYARVLYARLRAADELALDVLLVVPPPPSSIGPAVIDRIRRAASR
jgi:L-threonylcarbamoyladenylate synthase